MPVDQRRQRSEAEIHRRINSSRDPLRTENPLPAGFTGRHSGHSPLRTVLTNGRLCSTRNAGTGGHYRAALRRRMGRTEDGTEQMAISAEAPGRHEWRDDVSTAIQLGVRSTRPSCTPRPTSWRNGSPRACCRRSRWRPGRRRARRDHAGRAPPGAGRRRRAVEFPDPAVVHRVPPFTVAHVGRGWSRQVTSPRRAARPSSASTSRACPGCDDNAGPGLDLALNVAVVGLPITVLCPYRTDDPELARVEATHPRLVTASGLVLERQLPTARRGARRIPAAAPARARALPARSCPSRRGPRRAAPPRRRGRRPGRHRPRPGRGPRAGGERDRVEQHRAREQARGTCRLRGWTDEAAVAEIADGGSGQTFRSPAWWRRPRPGSEVAGCGWPPSCATSCRYGATARAPWSGCGWITKGLVSRRRPWQWWPHHRRLRV